MPRLGEGKPRTEEQRRRQREYSQRFYANHPERVKQWVRKWQTEGNPEAWREIMCRRVGGQLPTRPMPEVCEICDRPEGKGRRLHYEHCHRTGIFRGWTCGRCNRVLAQAYDSPELLRKMADYLEAAQANK